MSTRNLLRRNDHRFRALADAFSAAEMLRHLGSFTGANTAPACALAERHSPAELLDEFAKLVEQPSGLGRVFPPRLLLGDHVTHELDILFALSRDPDIPAAAVVAVLDTQVALPNPFVPAFRNSRGLRLRAVDIPWSHGETGPVVSGRAVDLLASRVCRPRIALPRARRRCPTGR